MSRLTGPPRAEVIGRVAHDLRATLNAIAGWGGALETAPLSPDDIRRAGAALTRQAHLTSRKLDAALDLWRLDVGLMDFTPSAADAASLARAAVGTCVDASAQRGIACDVVCADDSLAVHVNSRRVVQALALLVEEIIGLAPVNGRVTIHVERDADDVRIAVVPAGGATPRGNSWPFTRSLAVALIEMQGGRVDAGDGGAFTISLPCAPASALTDGDQMPRDDG